jgi:hypothetical protein
MRFSGLSPVGPVKRCDSRSKYATAASLQIPSPSLFTVCNINRCGVNSGLINAPRNNIYKKKGHSAAIGPTRAWIILKLILTTYIVRIFKNWLSDGFYVGFESRIP